MTTTARHYAAIKTNTPTRYEVAFCRGNETVKVLGYTARKTKAGITNLCTEDLTLYMTDSEVAECDTFTLKYSKANGYQVASNLYIRFTGNTERSVAA